MKTGLNFEMEIDFFNARSVIVFICILQGGIFAGLLLFRRFKSGRKADFWLAVLLLVICSSLITPFIGFANVYNLNQWLTFFPFNIAYASGVCIWFYVLTLTNAKREFGSKDWRLFVPSILYLIFRFVLFAQNTDFKDWFNDRYYVPFVSPFIFITEFLWNGAFLYFSIRHYRKYRVWLDENYADTEQIKFSWLRNFLYVFTFIFVLGAIFDFTGNFLFRLSYIQYFYFELTLALLTYYLAIDGYLRSQPIELSFTETESEETEELSEDRKSLLPESDLANLKAKLQNLMETEKPYLDPQLTLSNLAKQLGTNTTVLSFVINNGFDKNFNDFINEFRVAEVKSKLTDRKAENLNLLGIALDSGFNSKSTFNRAFKKFTNLSPKEFLDRNT